MSTEKLISMANKIVAQKRIDLASATKEAGLLLQHEAEEWRSSLRDVDYLNLCCVSGAPTALDAARCAMATDLKASGCRTAAIPRRIRKMYGQARETVGAFTAEPTQRRALGRALRKLAVMRSTAQRLAKHDQCGDTLGLMMTYARNVVGAARAAAPVTAP